MGPSQFAGNAFYLGRAFGFDPSSVASRMMATPRAIGSSGSLRGSLVDLGGGGDLVSFGPVGVFGIGILLVMGKDQFKALTRHFRPHLGQLFVDRPKLRGVSAKS